MAIMRRLSWTMGLGLCLLTALWSAKPSPTLAADQAVGTRSQPAASAAAETPGTDARLQQHVCVHATNQRLADLLGWLSKATGVTLVAHLEIADERLSYWTDDRPLMDVMRDLRHLHGYYWSRAKRSGGYVYSLWQDAQSRAREEAAAQRLALEEQRKFAEGIRKHVQALSADEKELKRLAQEDPYFVAQMIHPVVRAGYQLFAALSPDQQAQLLQGQTPSRGLPAGELSDVVPLKGFTVPSTAHPGQTETVFGPAGDTARWAPQGDVVTLHWDEMAPAQRTVVAGIFQAAQAQIQKEQERLQDFWGAHSRPALESAAMETATVSLFSWGPPAWKGMSLRVDFQSAGIPWCLYSNIALAPQHDRDYSDWIRKGEFRVWPGAQQDLNRYLSGDKKGGEPSPPAETTLQASTPPDPVLDAPVSLAWKLPTRGGRHLLYFDEMQAALHDSLRRPLVIDGRGCFFDLPHGAPPEFRWEKRPLRELLGRLFPRWECSSHGDAIFLRDPDRLQERWNPVPPSVEQFLKQHQGPFTLDDMALLARSLSPWQLVKLTSHLPPEAVDQMLAAQDLLKLYGELAPGQRAGLSSGMPFSLLTPPQQMLFLQFAQRQQPFVEPWRFQHGVLRLATHPASPPEASPWFQFWRPVSRAEFQVSFQEGDTQDVPVDLFARQEQPGVIRTLADWVGRQFPFREAARVRSPDDEDASWRPALADSRLRHRAELIVIFRPFVNPYAGTRPPPTPAAWARELAEKLRSSGVRVVLLTLGGAEPAGEPRNTAATRSPGAPSPVILLRDSGDINGQPFDGGMIEKFPTLLMIDSNETVRAVFEGQASWDMAAVERAVRRLSDDAHGAPRAAAGR